MRTPDESYNYVRRCQRESVGLLMLSSDHGHNRSPHSGSSGSGSTGGLQESACCLFETHGTGSVDKQFFCSRVE